MLVAVAHSFTDQGRAAVLAAAELARERDQCLAVLHVVEAVGNEPGDTVRQSVEHDVAGILDAAGGTPVPRQVHVVTAGLDPAGAMVDLVAEVSPEMLVIGTRRRSPVGKLLLGSMVQRVLFDAPVPVLVVKA